LAVMKHSFAVHTYKREVLDEDLCEETYGTLSAKISLCPCQTRML